MRSRIRLIVILAVIACATAIQVEARDSTTQHHGRQKTPKVPRKSKSGSPDWRALLPGWEFTFSSGRKSGDCVIEELNEASGPAIYIRKIINAHGRDLEDTCGIIMLDSIVSMQRLVSVGHATLNAATHELLTDAVATFETHDFSKVSLEGKIKLVKEIMEKDDRLHNSNQR